MNVNKIKKIVVSVSSCLLLISTSCSMDAELTSQYSEDVAFSNETNLELYLNKFYPLIGQTYYTPAINDDAYSDILKMNTPSDDQNGFAFGTIPVTPSANVFNNWQWGHTWVLDCNQFLAGLREKGGHLPENVRLRAEAEVRFFRAHVYFMMARRFGASVILYEDLPNIEVKSRPRCTPEECWDFIAADLDFASENLPLTPLKGKLSKGAAYGLKARVMLYAKRWKAASDAAEAVMNLKIYDLYQGGYGELFKLTRKSGVENKESILEFGYQAPDFGYSFDYFFCPPGDGGYAQVSPTENLVSAYQMADGSAFDWNNPMHAANPYENREPRFYASILYNGAAWKGRTIESYEGGVDGVTTGAGSTNTGYYLKKLFDETQVGGFQNSELTYYYMRYAEIYLIYAEAMVEQDEIGTALEYLNKVRRRAGFTTDLTAGSKAGFMSLLRHERMIELAFEGHRFWDLRRWGLAKATLDGVTLKGVKPIKNSDGSFSYSVISCDNNRTRIYLDKYERFPIPTSEIQRNPLCEQFDEWK